MAARAASAPWETPLLIVVRCHWFARKQKATNHRKDKKPGEERSWSVPALLHCEEHKPAALEIFRAQRVPGSLRLRRGPHRAVLKEADPQWPEKQGWKEPGRVTQCVACLKFSSPSSQRPHRTSRPSLDTQSLQPAAFQPARRHRGVRVHPRASTSCCLCSLDTTSSYKLRAGPGKPQPGGSLHPWEQRQAAGLVQETAPELLCEGFGLGPTQGHSWRAQKPRDSHQERGQAETDPCCGASRESPSNQHIPSAANEPSAGQGRGRAAAEPRGTRASCERALLLPAALRALRSRSQPRGAEQG